MQILTEEIYLGKDFKHIYTYSIKNTYANDSRLRFDLKNVCDVFGYNDIDEAAKLIESSIKMNHVGNDLILIDIPNLFVLMTLATFDANKPNAKEIMNTIIKHVIPVL
jgi:hypothetical protein